MQDISNSALFGVLSFLLHSFLVVKFACLQSYSYMVFCSPKLFRPLLQASVSEGKMNDGPTSGLTLFDHFDGFVEVF